MKRLILFISLTLLLSSIALAGSGSVYVLNIHYDNGIMTLNNIDVTSGFYPDYKIQSGDYKLEVISPDKQTLFSLDFKAPRIYADRSERLTGEIDGAVIDLRQADFTLIIPFFKEGKDIKIYKEDKEVFSTGISQFSVQQSPERSFTWFYISAIVILVLIIIAVYLFKKKNQ